MAPRKANQPQLTREKIVSATMKLIDEHGLGGHSMRQLGAELGIDPSSVYYYIPSKAALYDLIVDEIVSGIDLSIDDPAASFADRVVAASREYRRALLRHPKAVPLVAVRSMRTPVQLRVVEGLSRIFFDAGFSPSEAIVSIDACGMAILGMTNSYAASVAQSEYREHGAALGEGAGEVLPPDQYPNLARMIAVGADIDPDLEFDQTMRAMATGLHAMHEAGLLGMGGERDE